MRISIMWGDYGKQPAGVIAFEQQLTTDNSWSSDFVGARKQQDDHVIGHIRKQDWRAVPLVVGTITILAPIIEVNQA